MKIKRIKIKNFRGYRNEVCVEVNNLTTFVGKNDIGKSTILEGLDIFFNENKGIIKLDKDDLNKQAAAEGETEIQISVTFSELPDNVILDATNSTSLADEYLLNNEGDLEIIKRYATSGKEKVYIRANHPSNVQCNDLILRKDSELRTILTNSNINCEDRTRNSVMRAAIWNHFSENLELVEQEIEINKGDTKAIWSNLSEYLPQYSLFQSDRKNSDGDSEVQDPLKEAIKQIINNDNLRIRLNDIANEVEAKLREVSDRTLEKLREMNPDIANTLSPVIPTSDSLKWQDVFKNVSISGDENIPINKRGSGVKRLILLNFFRAEAERRMEESNLPNIVYAIEEPETSQHTIHQRLLIDAFIRLSELDNTQIILTTHSSNVVKKLNFDNIRLISKNEEINCITPVQRNYLPYPSLNEVNHIAFSEVTEEYHNELYGYIEAENLLGEFKNGKTTMNYIKVGRNGNRNEQIILTEYIRHQIHHPENTLNVRFTFEQLNESIQLMRDFIYTNIVSIA